MTASLQEKNNKWYIVLNTYENGKRKQKWISTNLPVKGNKTRAQKMLRDTLAEYEKAETEAVEAQQKSKRDDILFTEAVKEWYSDKVADIGHPIDETTRQGYEILIEKHIDPYFKANGLKLGEINKDNLQVFFNEKAKNGRLDGKGGLAPRSLKLIKNIINQTLLFFVANGDIPNNPCQFVRLPSVERYNSKYYTKSQIDTLLDSIKNEPLYPLIMLTAIYGLRRSEAIGLQWSSVDFEAETVLICHTVAKVKSTVEKDKTKTTSSRRTYPMTPEIKNLLLDLKAQQEGDREFYGNTYHEGDYVFRWGDGRPFSPDYVSQKFRKLLKEHNMPHIRFHELRHSAASNLLNMDFKLEDVKDWLGHSTIKTTADVYGHLDASRKKNMAAALAGR